MDEVRTTVTADAGPRRPSAVRAGVHLGVLAALVLGSGAVTGRHATHAKPTVRQVERYDGPQYLHRYSTCCAGSKDPSMEVF